MTPVLRIVCAWCQSLIVEGSEPVSHGICASCKAKYFPERG
jgi:hypothetical protein